jgi:hypothetical protein
MFNLFSMCFGFKSTQEEYLPVYTESTEIYKQPKMIKNPMILTEPSVLTETTSLNEQSVLTETTSLNEQSVLTETSSLNEQIVLTETSNEELKFMLEKMNKKINILDKNIRKINKQNKFKKNVYNDNDYDGDIIKANSYLKSYGSNSHVTCELSNKMNGTGQHQNISNEIEVKTTKFYHNKILELLDNHKNKKSINDKFHSSCQIFDLSIDFLKFDFLEKFYNTFLEKTEEHIVNENLNEQQKNVMKEYNKQLIIINLTRFIKKKHYL